MARSCRPYTAQHHPGEDEEAGEEEASQRGARRAAVLLLAVAFALPGAARAGLYSPADQIALLRADRLDSVVYNSSSALLLEFYASWCGHCVAFSPLWKKLARDTREWKPAVHLAAIDCAEESNWMTCIGFGVKRYPTLKFFPAFTEKGSTGIPAKLPVNELGELRHLMVDMIEKHKESWPPACPPLEAASKTEIDSFFETNNVRYLALLFEDVDSYVGREVTLDLLQFENIAVRRVLKTETELVSQMGVTDFPSCYLYYPDGTSSRLSVLHEARTYYSYALRSLPGVVRTGKVSSSLTLEASDNTTAQQWREFNRSRVYMADLESALHYSLRVEVAAEPVIKGEDISTLKRYISVLVKYFPGRPMMKNLLHGVDTWLKAYSGSELPYSSLKEVLDNTGGVQEAVLSNSEKWVGCQGSKPHFRGFPCSMWTLFHVLTVQAKGDPQAEPQEVLQAMRGYIRSFFGCQACATHFEGMAEENMSEVRSASAAVLWLWFRHNQVNNRLAGALSEDPLFPKIQWPPPSLCPQCHGVKNGEHKWNNTAVLAFLSHYFSSERILDDYLQPEAELLQKQQPEEQQRKEGADLDGRQGQRGRGARDVELEVEEEEEEEEEDVAPAGRPSMLGLRRRGPPEDIVDLDSFINQHYKAKALHSRSRRQVELLSVQEQQHVQQRRLEVEMEMEEMEEAGPRAQGRMWIALLGVGFSRLDISLCVLLYLLSSTCLVAVYFYFKLRCRMRRPKVAQP